MKTLKKYKGKLTEWIVFTFIFFFLYDIIWAVADFEDFKQSIDGYYICLFVDLVYCAIFSCISLSVTKLLLRQRFVKLAEEERSLFLRSVVVIISINILIAGVCELLMNVIESEFIEVAEPSFCDTKDQSTLGALPLNHSFIWAAFSELALAQASSSA